MQLVELPNEVLAIVLQKLEFLDIVSCRRVCRLLRGIIDSSTAVQLSIELSASGKLDNPFCRLTNTQKLAELRRVNSAWSAFRWRHRVVPLSIKNYPTIYEFSGGYFFQDMNASLNDLQSEPPYTISWLPLPRTGSLGIEDWRYSHFDFRPIDIRVDVPRDLLVVFQRTRLASEVLACIAHFRTISTNGPHPDAIRPQVHFRFPKDVTEFSMINELGGDHIGLLFTFRQVNQVLDYHFHLWNWTTDVRKASVSSNGKRHWDAFCFVSEDAILLPDTLAGELNLYRFTDKPDSFRHSVSLALPETQEHVHVSLISVQCDPMIRPPSIAYESPQLPQSQNRLYTTDSRSAIVIVTIEYVLHMGEAVDGLFIMLPESHTFAIKRLSLLDFAASAEDSTKTSSSVAQKISSLPSSAVGDGSAITTTSHCAEGDVPRLPSQSWITHCRWGLSPSSPEWLSYTFGSRYISMANRSVNQRSPASLRLYDFNVIDGRRADFLDDKSQYEVIIVTDSDEEDYSDIEEEVEYIHLDRQAPTRISTPGSWKIKPVETFWEAEKIDRADIFKEPFETGLPYRMIETEAQFDWDSVVIDERHVIGIKLGDDKVLDFIDVLTF